MGSAYCFLPSALIWALTTFTNRDVLTARIVIDEPKREEKFAVLAEANDHARPLIMTHLSFAKLMDEVVLPYQTDQSFFIDGAPLKKDTLKRIKVIKQSGSFDTDFAELHQGMQRGELAQQQLYTEQYHVRLEAILRRWGEDVTAQVMKAFEHKIRPALKDYVPKREALIKGAFDFFHETTKALSK
jgi:hypothetical protein